MYHMQCSMLLTVCFCTAQEWEQQLRLVFHVHRAFAVVSGEQPVLRIEPYKTCHARLQLPACSPPGANASTLTWREFAKKIRPECSLRLSGVGPAAADAALTFKGTAVELTAGGLDAGGEFTLKLPREARGKMPELQRGAAAGELALRLHTAADWRPGGEHAVCVRIQCGGLELCGGGTAGGSGSGSGDAADAPEVQRDISNICFASRGGFR